jgi:hypothetical protein
MCNNKPNLLACGAVGAHRSTNTIKRYVEPRKNITEKLIRPNNWKLGQKKKSTCHVFTYKISSGEKKKLYLFRRAASLCGISLQIFFQKYIFDSSIL